MVRESTLPQREKQLFHKLVKSYEQKQFKQGLKHAKEQSFFSLKKSIFDFLLANKKRGNFNAHARPRPEVG